MSHYQEDAIVYRFARLDNKLLIDYDSNTFGNYGMPKLIRSRHDLLIEFGKNLTTSYNPLESYSFQFRTYLGMNFTNVSNCNLSTLSFALIALIQNDGVLKVEQS